MAAEASPNMGLRGWVAAALEALRSALFPPHLESPPEIVTRGMVDPEEAAELGEEAARLLASTLDARPPEERLDASLTRERVRETLRRFYKRRTQRRPMVIPVVMEV